MNRRQWIILFLIFFMGTCGIFSVDQQCKEITGMGGKAGLTISRTEEGNTAFCFFGLEGEIGL